MKTTNFVKVALRNNAIYVENKKTSEEITKETMNLVGHLAKNGFSLSEELLWAINRTSEHDTLKKVISEVLQINNNWAPLVKDWRNPTNESRLDHVITLFSNILESRKGTTLECGHLIPENTFPLERYNGCPFCGTPFEFGKIENFGQNSKLKVLNLWTENDVKNYFEGLITSKTALDATQVDSLTMLLPFFEITTDINIEMKETLMLVIDEFIRREESEKCGVFFKNPTDILRYLWYRHTGFLQIVPPKIIVQRNEKNHTHIHQPSDLSSEAKKVTKNSLKLKYSRKECKMVAFWLTNLPISVEKICEYMHPKRQMWVRFIRALRLTEYSKKKGFEKLNEILDVFYNEVYEVTQGELQSAKLKFDAEKTFGILKKRPGLFARSLFANMLWFGADKTISEFKEIADEVPMRLLLTLNMYAEIYFDKKGTRVVKPLLGNSKTIPTNKILQNFSDDDLEEMKLKIEDLCLWALEKRFKHQKTEAKTIYIDEQLYHIPLSIGDRTANIQNFSSALMGTKFPIEDTEVRLFMQWGKGLSAQHLDMDLSCHIAFEDTVEVCSYFNLTATGAKHSGDIQHIPNKVGTAEYINLDIKALQYEKAKYVTFTCNAYSIGGISPNLVVGWMNSKHPMKISRKTGVAYDPSCVAHQVRISQSMQKGLVFGVLDVENAEIIWLELPFFGQHIGNLSFKNVTTLIKKLDAKTTIGRLLELKAKAQNLKIVSEVEAEEKFDVAWAENTKNLNNLFLD